MTRDLAENLQRLRFDNKYSQEFVAKKIGVSLSTYYRFEKSEAEIELNTAIKIADLYKITLDELLHLGDPSFKVAEPKAAYQKRWSIPVVITLDGTAETLENCFAKLTAINAAL